ncbi:carboxypeptidase B-like [Agrilus planipennis]|uniref:Carboxypeptidase B-like n=1 Tax=Agrilus planipennis TaxID=224129 RepID=A0A7F5R9F9_AGRPL|nr:carboxypeptidase B-like [Agrilus planipennis]
MSHLIFIVLLNILFTNGLKYNGYQIVHIEPTKEQTELIHQNCNFDYITPLRRNGGLTKVVVKSEERKIVYNFLSSNKIKFTVIVDDLENYFKKERLHQLSRLKTFDRGTISFRRYERHETINNYLKSLASKYPELVSLENIGQSFEGRDMIVIKISTGRGTKQKPVIFIDAGIHAREWIAPATALYVVNQLVENSTWNNFMIQNADWYILPSLNPDGYEYTHTNDRLWRKTRSLGSECTGTDANRNFDFYWGTTGASSAECSEIYKGRNAFSEVELQNFKNFSEANKDKIKLYLTLHSYGYFILYPWGYTSDLPQDVDELQHLGSTVSSKIRDYSGTRFTVGSSTNVLYPAAGGSDDWMKGVNGVDLSYTIELQGDYEGFELPAEKILPAVRESFVGIQAFHSYVDKKYARM